MDLGLSEEAIEQTKARIISDLHTIVRRCLVDTTAQCLGSPSITILAALGVDAEATLLHIFKEEADLLLNQTKEGDNAR